MAANIIARGERPPDLIEEEHTKTGEVAGSAKLESGLEAGAKGPHEHAGTIGIHIDGGSLRANRPEVAGRGARQGIKWGGQSAKRGAKRGARQGIRRGARQGMGRGSWRINGSHERRCQRPGLSNSAANPAEIRAAKTEGRGAPQYPRSMTTTIPLVKHNAAAVIASLRETLRVLSYPTRQCRACGHVAHTAESWAQCSHCDASLCGRCLRAARAEDGEAVCGDHESPRGGSRLECPEFGSNPLADVIDWLKLGDIIVLEDGARANPYHKPGVEEVSPELYRVLHINVTGKGLADEGEWPDYLRSAGAVPVGERVAALVADGTAPHRFELTLGRPRYAHVVRLGVH